MTSTPEQSTDFPYGVTPVVVEDVREAVLRCHDAEAETVWAGLLEVTGLTGDETDEHSLTLLLEAMAGAGHLLTTLCAHSLRLRRATYSYLTDAHLRRYESDAGDPTDPADPDLLPAAA